MPTFDIIKEVKPKLTFRVSSVIGKFDLQSEHIVEHFKGNIDIADNWQVGLIVGKKRNWQKQQLQSNYLSIATLLTLHTVVKRFWMICLKINLWKI